MNVTRVRKICPEVLRKLTDPVMCTRGAILNCPSFCIKVQGQPLSLTILSPLTLILLLPVGIPPGEEEKTMTLQGRSFQQEEQGGSQHLRVGRECEGQVAPLTYDARMLQRGDGDFSSHQASRWSSITQNGGETPKVFYQEILEPEITLQIALGDPLSSPLSSLSRSSAQELVLTATVFYWIPGEENELDMKIFSSLGHHLSPSLPTPLHSLSFTRYHVGHRDLVSGYFFL